MTKLQAFLQSIINTEEEIIPIFVHNPASQTIASVIIAADPAVLQIVSELGAKPAAFTPAA